MRRRHKDTALQEVQALTMMPWLNDLTLIKPSLSNNIFLRANPNLATLQNFTYKMRRKLLYEKAMILRRIQTRGASYTKSKYPNPPSNENCELCGQPENWMHPMMTCTATRKIREEAHALISARLLRLGIPKARVDELPCWWAIDAGNSTPPPSLGNISSFNKTWGALGIIPSSIMPWLYKYATKPDEIPIEMANIHLDILRCMHNCWVTRCKRTTWKVRPPDRAVE
jgi:hypothetical protein